MSPRRLIPLVALAAALIGFAAQAPSALNPPGSLGGKCGVFPRPGGEVAADAASLDDQRAWNQDISEAPVDPRSDQIIDSINSNGGDALHPDFGSPREYGIPYVVVGKQAKRVKVKFTDYPDEASAYLRRRRLTRRPFARVHLSGGRSFACAAETAEGRELFLAASRVIDAAR